MSKETQKRTKKRWLRILLAIIILIAIISSIYLFLQYRRYQQAQSTLNNLETVSFQKGSLLASISGTGTVRASQSAVLSWATSGVIGDLQIKVGDKVLKDQVIVSLEEGSLPVDILQAKIDLISIESSLADLYDGLDFQLAQAEFDLIKAQKELDDAAHDRYVMDFGRCTDERIEELQEKYDEAYDNYKDWPNDATLSSVDIALANLNFCEADFSQKEIDEADARLRLAEEKVNELTTKVDQLKEGPALKDINILEIQKEIAVSKINRQFIKAPFDSTVTAIYGKQGDIVTSGSRIIQLADLSNLYVDVQISEVDIPMIEKGQISELVFDAYFEETYEGEVTEIAPVGNDIQGVVTYQVTIKMKNGLEKIKPGMTAAVNIIIDEKQDIFILPNAAISNVDGFDSVYVIRNGLPELIRIETGSFSDRSIEIITDEIREGELIVINPPTSVLSVMDSGPFGESFSGPGFLRGR